MSVLCPKRAESLRNVLLYEACMVGGESCAECAMTPAPTRCRREHTPTRTRISPPNTSIHLRLKESRTDTVWLRKGRVGVRVGEDMWHRSADPGGVHQEGMVWINKRTHRREKRRSFGCIPALRPKRTASLRNDHAKAGVRRRVDDGETKPGVRCARDVCVEGVRVGFRVGEHESNRTGGGAGTGGGEEHALAFPERGQMGTAAAKWWVWCVDLGVIGTARKGTEVQ
ncbi:hypothetical protein C8R44DRAFT_858820 [Mycena epipterygia]|nr:hypothetical protein C8R44DRAFT_858820 [Mycena epipterygia]